MSAGASPLQQLADIAVASEFFELDVNLGRNGETVARLYFRMGRWSGGAQGTINVHGFGRGGPAHKHFSGIDVVDLFRRAVQTAPDLEPDLGSMKLTIRKGPTTTVKAKPVVARALHEVYGLAVPTEAELADREKAAKSAKKSEMDQALKLLRDGTAGVESFSAASRTRRDPLDLRKADLSGLALDGVWFGGTELEGADLSGSSLVGARFDGPAGIKLKGVKFVGADLTRATLWGASCLDADFTRAVLRDANAVHGRYARALLHGADLTGADLTGSDLRGADFTDALLADVKLDMCRFDETTKWPKGYKIPLEPEWKGAGADPRLAVVEKQIKKSAPTDLAGFLDRLKTAADPAKLDKATAMLKADRFRLFAKVEADRLVGVVKSQSDPDLVYACRLDAQGNYSCCTQNLNVCGGLRGSPCKHLLVLLVGLAKAGEIDPATAHLWIQLGRGRKPALDRDAVADVLLQYKGAEAGEVDWRPTETLPEDFYAM